MLGIGVDAVDIDRFRGILSRRPHIAERLFTSGEQEYADRYSDPAPRLAARFAAKEAALKALGAGIGAARSSATSRSSGARMVRQVFLSTARPHC